MSPSNSASKPRSAIVLSIAIASTLTASCATSTKRSPVSPNPSPLVIANCPPLAPLTDASFGATTAKLVDVGHQYRKCRAAALGNSADPATPDTGTAR